MYVITKSNQTMSNPDLQKLDATVEENNHDENTKDTLIPIKEPQNMKSVKEEYAKLQYAINELGDKVSGILQKQETEFLTAYRSHMRNVEKDFIDLKDDIDRKEKAIEDNILVKQLETERDWYKKEALHLDQLLIKTKKKEVELSEKVDELELDRKWLSNQLKVVMKEKSLLERRCQQTEECFDEKPMTAPASTNLEL